MTPFAATFNGRSVFEYTGLPRSKIRYSSEFEWREAAHWRRKDWDEFLAMDGEEQSAIIAHYRVHHQIEAILANEQHKAQARANRNANRGH